MKEADTLALAHLTFHNTDGTQRELALGHHVMLDRDDVVAIASPTIEDRADQHFAVRERPRHVLVGGMLMQFVELEEIPPAVPADESPIA